MSIPIRIGTRGSPLALWQARHVASLLQPLAGTQPVELIEIETKGDTVRDVPLSQIGGDGVFTKEIQRALVDGRVDVAVHSLKDLPTTPVEELVLAAIPARGPSGDAFVSRRYRRFDDLPPGATLGTSSLRRRSQVLHRRPDLRLVDMRGNVETRLHKLDTEGLDALILAQAGLERLGLAGQITEILDPHWMLPAPGQGALGLECRANDTAMCNLLAPLNDASTRASVLAERAMLRGLGGGCLVPVGVTSEIHDGWLSLCGAVLSSDGTARIAVEESGSVEESDTVGCRLAEILLKAGARELLTSIRR